MASHDTADIPREGMASHDTSDIRREGMASHDTADIPREETSAGDHEAVGAGAPLPSMPFWRLEEMTFTDSPPERAQREKRHKFQEPLTRDDLESPGRSLLATPPPSPLTPWYRLWPVVRSALQSRVPGRSPDVPALLHSWSRGDVVRRVPRVTRSVWAQRASVWIDWSPRLVPFRFDQQEVYGRIRALCGKSGVTLRILDSAAQAWSRRTRGRLPGGVSSRSRDSRPRARRSRYVRRDRRSPGVAPERETSPGGVGPGGGAGPGSARPLGFVAGQGVECPGAGSVSAQRWRRRIQRFGSAERNDSPRSAKAEAKRTWIERFGGTERNDCSA